MRSRTNKPRAQTTEFKLSRAALRTIESVVATVEHGIKQLDRLQNHLYSAHAGALATLHVARHHSLNGPDLHHVEGCVGELAERLDWPAEFKARIPHDHLERPLNDDESWEVARWANSAFEIAAGVLDVSETFDVWYATLVARGVDAARSAFPRVTAEEHKRKATKLMLRLDQLCADERIAGALASVDANDGRATPGEAICHEHAGPSEADDAIARCGRVTTWPH